ncbi:ankyrin repeat containing [Fusarium agapanthi]|uniref:Ankyrin repeat containing n=1 Tax=Fusarium agapanthi TaxID=1803897 RepID=A0A9P5B2G5_9HYPO|nr:ankyrin repeat containing [Fusarium agapanthi]
MMTPPSSHPLSESMSRRVTSMQLTLTRPTTCDTERCHQLMSQHRIRNNKTQSLPFTIKDANPVLATICRGGVPDATPGLVCALFEAGADVNVERYKSTSVFKKLQDVNQQDVRNHILRDAVKNCSGEVFYLLAQKADGEAVKEALPVAIASGDANKTYILLARGGDASPLCDAFLRAVETGPVDLVEMLLRDTSGACQVCRNQGLAKAIVVGSSPKATVLLRKGADPTANDGAVVQSAIQAGLEQVAILAVTVGQSRLSSEFLDKTLGLAYSHKQFEALLACASAGAKGSNTNATLVNAVSSIQPKLVNSLLQHGADIATDDGAAITAAVRTRDPAMLALVLRYKPPPQVAIQAMVQVTKLQDVELAYQMIDQLLVAGLRGHCVSQALVGVLDRTQMPGDDRRRLELARLLLLKGAADINWNRGQTVITAVLSQQTSAVGLLLQCQPSLDTLGNGLKHAVRIQDSETRLQMTRLLLGAGQSGSKNRLERIAIIAAAKELHLDLFEFLAPISHSPQNLIIEAFVSATSNNAWSSRRGLPTIQALLRRGASGQPVDNAFCTAASQSITTGCATWQSDENLEAVHSILEAGCSGDPVSAALISALNSYVNKRASEDLVDTLLEYADVNFKHGEAANIAVQAGDVTLLKKLVEHHLNSDTLSRSFATVLATPLEEAVSLDLIETILEAAKPLGNKIDLEMSLPLSGLSSVAACISIHSQSVLLIKRLLELSCSPDKQFLASLSPEFGEESTTALLWVLAQSNAISVDVLKILIKAQANVDYIAPKSKLTALMLAAKAQRHDIVGLLLKANANPLNRDYNEDTALLFASRAGDLASVKSLIKAKSSTDDGSLHEASRHLHHEVVAALLKGKHNANYPSHTKRHNGRTAIQELASRVQDMGDMLRLERTIRTLVESKADLLLPHIPSGRKNSLFLALENPQPVSVTRALIKVAMWAQINHPDNVYIQHMESGTKWYFSPTMYLMSSCFTGGHLYVEELRTMLYMAQCQDRKFPEYGPAEGHQLLPEDVVGAPQHILDKNAKRLVDKELREKREQDHQTKLRFMHEEALHKGYIQDIHISQKLEHSYRTHQVDIVNQTEKTELQQGALERKNALVAAGQQQVEQHKARNAYIDVTTQQTQQQLKLSLQEQQAKSKIGQQKMQNVLASEAQSSKLAGQKQAQALKAASDRSAHALKAREHKMKMEEARAKQKLRR